MKYLSIFLLVISCNSTLIGQNEANIWHLGRFAGIDFNQDPPVPLLDGQLNTTEGCASIADINGNLLFYTDGSRVWNRNHLVMPGVIGGALAELDGDGSSSQSAIIIPKPNTSNLYYIFTVDDGVDTPNPNGGPDGLRYSEVDMTLDGGLGDIIVATKNTPLVARNSEKITAVMHANQLHVWVVTHKANTDEFHAYLVTDSGVQNTAVISSVGSVVDGMDPLGGGSSRSGYFRGCMKISPNGQRLAIAHNNFTTELFDFNTSTGEVSNPLIVNNHTESKAFGVEFSPSNKFLYVSSNLGAGLPSLLQYDLDAADIPSSVEVIDPSVKSVGSLQLGPDKKIYVSVRLRDTLAVINDPDVKGVACNYDLAGFYLGDGDHRTQFGLPQFIQSFFEESNISFTGLCANNPTNFSNNGLIFDSIKWSFGDPASGTLNISTLENPTHIYTTVGSYMVSSIVFNGTFSDTSLQTVNILPIAMSATSIMICPGDSLLVDGVFRSDAGTYNDTIIGGASTGCDSIASVTLSFFLPSVFNYIFSFRNMSGRIS